MSEKTHNEGMPRYRPLTDIIEQEDGFHIFMDLPGVHKETLAVDINDNELTVSARTAYAGDPSSEGQEKYAHLEFGGGEYHRSFTLSHNVDRDKIAARLENGVLNLHLPKSNSATPKRIEIRSG